MNPRGLRVTQSVYFSLFTHTQKLLLVPFHKTTAEIRVSFRTHGKWNMEGQRDVTVEIVI